MYTQGIYKLDEKQYGVLLNHTRRDIEIVLLQDNQIVSAYKKNGLDEYLYINTAAQNFYNSTIRKGLSGCSSRNGVPMNFALGTSIIHTFSYSKTDYTVELFNDEIVGFEAYGYGAITKITWSVDYVNVIPKNIPYVKINNYDFDTVNNDDEQIKVRSIEEIALYKDISWIKNKNYYIVNDDSIAEQIFNVLDNYNGYIAYDTETSGLKINCFSKINSSYQKSLQEYNESHPDEKIRADYLVGIIFCIEPHTSYYFPCKNRKFDNLYTKDTETKRKVVQDILDRYTVGEFKDKQSDMASYIHETPVDQWSSDVILMERVRSILTKKHITTHGGKFEWKVGWCYEIDTNIQDDTLIMHQLLYKFRGTTANRGEPSNLKYLTLREFGVDQLELSDFFPDYSENSDGNVREHKGKKKKRKKNSKIDFSYMDYVGSKIYAPADGDFTLELFFKYKQDMLNNPKFREQEYLYSVEVIVECAIGYMEFYGHRLDETKILSVRDHTKAEIVCIESEIRQIINYCSDKELSAYNSLKETMDLYDKAETKELASIVNRMNQQTEALREIIDTDVDNPFNLASPAQVCTVFYDILKIPVIGEKRSVAKSVYKALLKYKNEDGSVKYPIVELYAKYKSLDTLLVKFFDNLPYFMYPGGYIFSDFGQISTATGRMSCQKPNAQQYPKEITNIVVPRDGYVMLDADYSQIEYRVLVALSGEERLAEQFKDPDSDYHTMQASSMFGVPYASVTPDMRKASKSFNFGIPYGMGIGSLAILLSGVNNEETRVDAAKKYELYFKDQPKVREFFNKVKEMAQINKFTTTFWRRYRYYSFTDAEGNVDNKAKASALRQAGNAVIQGCLHGDTLIKTREEGIVPIKDVVDNSLYVWDGDKWSRGDILYSGKKRKCIITFDNGQKFICSPEHKFLVNNTGKFVECKNLKTELNSENPNKVVVSTYNKIQGLFDEQLINEIRQLYLNCGVEEAGKIKISVNSTYKLQETLLFFGIKTTAYKNNGIDAIEINEKEAEHFKSLINFDLHSDGSNELLTVKSVEITDEYIDMYDVCNTDGGYYVADGIVTHNTAADIFKISVARNFMYIRNNNLYGLFLIVNMIHDEQLFELNVDKLNIQKVLSDIGKNMQFKIDGFPPLFIGAGLGPSWAKAKDKMAEIHPYLLDRFTSESENTPIYKTENNETPSDVLDYFSKRVLDYSIEKIKNYITDKNNIGKDLHPAIGNLLNLRFTYGHSKKKEGLSDSEFTALCLDEFIKHNDIIGITSSDFVTKDSLHDTEEDKEYDDDNNFDEDNEFSNLDFSLVQDNAKLYGASMQDLIRTFGFFVSKNRQVCGVDITKLNNVKRKKVVDYLYGHICDKSDAGAMEIIFLMAGNILCRTKVYVNGIDGSDVEALMKISNMAV